MLGVEPLHLLRIYATILEGRRALDISRDDFFIAAFALHIVTGILFGTIFALGARESAPDSNATFWRAQVMGLPSGWRTSTAYCRGFSLCCTEVHSSSTEIPIAVAVLTHVSYGLTVVLVTYVLQRDFMYPSQTNARTKE